jgi:4-amino-4-deoxy-L-arabinose transferase-like glycosyltransferase
VTAAVAAALVTFTVMKATKWAPGDLAVYSDGQGVIGAIVVGLAVAIPWLLWIWSRPDPDSSARQTRRTSRLLREFNTDIEHDHRHGSDRDQF